MDLFGDVRKKHFGRVAPLAVRMRPRTLDEFVGQRHFLGPGKLLRRMLEADRLTSVIFYGPPGTGKTTLAQLVATYTKSHFEQVNAAAVGVKEVREVLYYDDLDPRAYDTGVCVLHGDAFARLWSLCREKKLTVVGDAHSHPGAALQSHSDRTNPMVAREGHIAIIVPEFARWPIRPGKLGVYEYVGDHTWRDRGGLAASRYFYRGFWA